MIPKRPYINPKIRFVELNPEQAMLNVCQVGGGYMSGPGTPNTTYCMGGGGGTIMAICALSIRGKSDHMTGLSEPDVSPS